jgi:hypothetical protein
VNIKREDITERVELPRFVYAPVKRGDVIGRIIFTCDKCCGKTAGYSIITVSEDIDANIPGKSIFSRIADLFRK